MELRNKYRYIDPIKYKNSFADLLWYLKIHTDLREYFYDCHEKKEDKSRIFIETREEIIRIACNALGNNEISLGESGTNWDKERLNIDTIVIHHTSTSPDTPIIKIEILNLFRLYAAYYSMPDSEVYKTPLWSNHFYKGKQTFIAYHYLIRRNGDIQQILRDEHIGWHCGDWNFNRRSIALCFIDDLTFKRPSERAIQSAKKLINKYNPKYILGHAEINKNTTCPGHLFLSPKGWKQEMIKSHG